MSFVKLARMARLFTVLPLLAFLVSCKPESDVAIANREGILIMGNSNEPKGLDPHLVSGVLESNIIRALFEGLFIDSPDEDNVALPAAAESYEVNEDFTVWTFKLQPYGRWSDGVPVTSHDFVFSYRRLLSPDPNWPAKYAEMLYFIKNAQAFHQNQRGFILCGQDVNFPAPWEDLQEVNFRGNDSLAPSPYEGKRLSELKDEERAPFLDYVQAGSSVDFDKLLAGDFSAMTSAEKAIHLNYKGLDKATAEELAYIQQTPESFTWPANVPMEAKTEVLRRLLEHRREGSPSLWDAANVGVTAVDDFTLRVELRGPVPYLPEVTKHYTWYPVPRHIILKHGDINTAFSSRWTQPGNLVSNGPFKLKEWRTNHYIEVEKNEHYWDKENVALNGIRYLPISNYYTESRMFSDGQLHVTYTIPSELIPWAKEKYPQRVRQEPYVGVRFLRTNITREPFDNPKVRLAFATAIDRKAICEKILQGGQKPAKGIVPPFGDYESPGKVTFDPEKARQLLKESGYKSTSAFPDISILTTDSDSGRREAEALQAMWDEHLGIKARIVQREWTTYLQRQYDKDYDIAVNGWIGDYLDPTTFLEMWTAGNGNNNTGWASEEYEDLLKQAENTADPAKRLEILAQAETIVLDDSPVLPIYWYTTNYLLREEVKNWNPLLLNNHPFKFVELKP
ncbi:MAG: peptide ABC transporter substrate-binding protein [Verrucomicrobiota bacterium JB023]|nr:peptide ABC transporter substrate-binding protein [Verrucomicrobiota bacterium JB023]